jgi:hypothetical protein
MTCCASVEFRPLVQHNATIMWKLLQTLASDYAARRTAERRQKSVR